MSFNPGFQRQCRWLRAATLLVLAGLLLLLALGASGLPWLPSNADAGSRYWLLLVRSAVYMPALLGALPWPPVKHTTARRRLMGLGRECPPAALSDRVRPARRGQAG